MTTTITSTGVEACAHPAETRSTLKDGHTIVCTACQTRLDAPQRTVCAAEATSHPAAVKLANTAGDHGWATQLTAEGDAITLRLSRGDDHGHVAWVRNTEGAWRFSTCLIAQQRFGAREIPERLARANAPVVSDVRKVKASDIEVGMVVEPDQSSGAMPRELVGTGHVVSVDRRGLDRYLITVAWGDGRGTGQLQWCGADTEFLVSGTVDGPGHLATVTPIRPGPSTPVTPQDAVRLAPPPPSAPVPVGGVMPTGTLATFMTAPRATPVNGNTEWATRYAGELRGVIEYAGRNSARNLQIRLGPSELGVPCDRQVAGKLAGIPSTNHVSDPWPSIVGTAIHAWLADAFRAENARHGLRWVPECRVSPHPDHPGTADLYDSHSQAVVDWKNLSFDKIETLAAKGPSMQYQTQLLLYGRGYRNLGLPVRRVVLVALPRTKSTLDGMYVWDHELTQADDDAIEEVFKLTAIRKQWADEIRSGRINLLNVPATPDSDTCYFCPFYRPQAAHDGGIGCPGTVH